ncbi:MAG: PASTA domain-containing protein, partial [Candidatus Hydrogenedens sp.]
MLKKFFEPSLKNHAGMIGLFLILSFFVIVNTGWSAILIDNIEDLQKIGNDPEYPINESYELSQDIDASITYSWNEGSGFQPIGSSSNPFSGTLDGKGYQIFNLYINRSSEDYVGLFGRVSSNGKILNLGLENNIVIGKNYVGGLIGSNEGRADTCYANGSVSGTNNVGGLAGNNTGTLNKCYSTNIVAGATTVGGLAGRNAGTISQCYSTSNVSGTSAVGGLIGANATWNASLRRCYAGGNVSGTSNIGGLIGSMSWGWAFETYSIGHVSGSSRIGGLVGYRFFLAFIFMSYWDKDTSGLATSSGGTAKTTEQMKQQSTYTNWSFGSVWGIIPGVTYPYFIWTYPVPNLLGLTVEEANSVLTSTGYVLGTVSEQCSFTTPAGLIMIQQPFPGQYLEPGSPVNVTISTGPCPPNTVPNVVGLKQSIAENEIVSAGYVVGTVGEQCNNTIPAGYVISQEPAGGEELEPGNAVNIIVSTGPCPIAVPNVVGMTEENADVTLVSAGLFLGVVSEQCSDTIPQGRIISQNPLAGTQVIPGSYVDVVISSGPCGEGTSEGIPEGTLEGIEEGIVEGTPEGIPEGVEEGIIEGIPEGILEGTPEGVEEGIVEGTPEGTPEGSIEGENVITPNVVGQPFVNAVFAINNAQLVVGVITEVCTDEYPFGVIIAQEPVGGSIVEIGSMVNLWVSIGPCPPEGEGVVEGTPEGTPEGIPEGVVEGTPEG